MKRKKIFLIVFFMISLSISLFSINEEYFAKEQLQVFTFNKKISKFNKFKSLIIPVNLEDSYIDQFRLPGSYIFLKESIEEIFNNKTYSNTEPDLFVVFTFINSLYYLLKFKINLWIYNKSIFFKNNNKFKPYFNINYKNKLFCLEFDIFL